MTEREMEVASNLELQRRYDWLLSQAPDDITDEDQDEIWLIEEEQQMRADDARQRYEYAEDTPCLDDPWWVHP